MRKNAVISECQKYRYMLQRPTDLLMPEQGECVFVLLNPSTADETIDDPTIRRCRGFAKSWGCKGLTVLNLYAYRATNPKELWEVEDPVGPANDVFLTALARGHRHIVCGWGANAKDDRVFTFLELMEAVGARLFCLGKTKSGAPRHPLYVRADQPLELWPGEENSTLKLDTKGN